MKIYTVNLTILEVYMILPCLSFLLLSKSTPNYCQKVRTSVKTKEFTFQFDRYFNAIECHHYETNLKVSKIN